MSQENNPLSSGGETTRAENNTGTGYDPSQLATLFGVGITPELAAGIEAGKGKKILAGMPNPGDPGLSGKVPFGVTSEPEFDGQYTMGSNAPGIRRAKQLTGYDQSMYPFNIVAGSRSGNKVVVGKDDRMSPKELRQKLGDILSGFGLMTAPYEFSYDFTQAMFLAHALNGASVVGPGRASFTVASDSFSYGDVLKFLGPDARRFFRGYADDIARALSRVLDQFDPGDPDSVRICGQIRAIAVARNLVQFPYLIHDSADACVKLSPAEYAAVIRSKELVLNSTTNSVDGLVASTSKK